MCDNYKNVDVQIDKNPDINTYMSNSYQEGYTYGHLNNSSITRTIGRGEDAKNSVIWHIIFTTFCVFSCVVSALIIIDLYRTNGKDSVQIVKDVWSIFTPILTLSLGYMFGREKNEQKNPINKIKTKQDENI